MHEPDGVKGVNALRREEPSLREQILEHESIGLLRDATACYDRAIQLESDQVHSLTRTNTHTHRYVRNKVKFIISFSLDRSLSRSDDLHARSGTAVDSHHSGQWCTGQQVREIHTHMGRIYTVSFTFLFFTVAFLNFLVKTESAIFKSRI